MVEEPLANDERRYAVTLVTAAAVKHSSMYVPQSSCMWRFDILAWWSGLGGPRRNFRRVGKL